MRRTVLMSWPQIRSGLADQSGYNHPIDAPYSRANSNMFVERGKKSKCLLLQSESAHLSDV
jgi:hypothetical protein